MYKMFYNMAYNPFSKTIKVKDTYETPDLKQVHARLDHLKNFGGIFLFQQNQVLAKHTLYDLGATNKIWTQQK